MSKRKGDIPGFYMDPKTGKYYLEKPGNAENPILKRLKIFRAAELEGEPKFPASKSVLQHVRARELGNVSATPGVKDFYKMKINTKRLLNIISISEVSMFNIEAIEFVKGGGQTIFGMWTIKRNSKTEYVVGETPYDCFSTTPESDFSISKYVIDMCEGPDDSLVCLYDIPPLLIRAFLQRQADTNSAGVGPFDKPPLFCCTTGVRGQTYAVGGENYVRIFRGYRCENSLHVSGRCHTISFDKSQNLVAAGIHSGLLCISDIRTNTVVSEIPASNGVLMDSAFLDPQHLIVAGVDNTLVQVDTRNREIVTEYYGHQQSTKKRPFSLAHEMLCATGVDNRIRIWHLSGGNPLHVLKSQKSPENEIRGWLHANGNKTYLSYFEGPTKKVFQIM